MQLPKLPRPSLPWVLLLFIALGATVFGTYRLLVMEVEQWGVILDADPGVLPSTNGIRLRNPLSTDIRCDSLSLERLYPSPQDSQMRRLRIAGIKDGAPSLRLDQAFHGRPTFMVSNQWSSAILPSLTVRSAIALPFQLTLDFPSGMTILSPQGSLASWRLGPIIGLNPLSNTRPEATANLEARNRMLVLGRDSVGFLAFEASIPSPGRVEILNRGADTVCFVNRGKHVLHDFAAIATAFQPGRGGRTPRLEPGQTFCLTETGRLPDARTYALGRELGEVQARAFASRWNEQQIDFLPHPSVQWCAWLDPAALDSAIPLHLAWPLTRIRRHVLLVHRESILDSNGCPEGRRFLDNSEPSESRTISWGSVIGDMHNALSDPPNPRLQQTAMEHQMRMQQGTDAPRIGHNFPMPALELGQLRWEGNSERSEASVLQVLRAHLPGLGHLVRKSLPLLESIPHRRFTLHFTISPEGQVIAGEVVGNLPSPLRDAMRDKVSRYRFPVLGIRSNATVRIDVRISGVKFPKEIGPMGGS
ncbi:MAG: hypothetical protein RL318_2370 [Fibrobacterota bacterium]|jgi:hypothetical protein